MNKLAIQVQGRLSLLLGDICQCIEPIANPWTNSLLDLEDTNNELDKPYCLSSSKLSDDVELSQTQDVRQGSDIVSSSTLIMSPAPATRESLPANSKKTIRNKKAIQNSSPDTTNLAPVDVLINHRIV